LTLHAQSTDIGGIILWAGLLLAAVILLIVVLWYVRRWFFAPPEESTGDIWSLQHLRELRRSGQISEDEYQRLKSQVIAQFQSPSNDADSDAQVPPG